MSSTAPNLPALTASTSYSFYPYPLKSGPSTSLRGLAPPAQTPPQAGPSTNRQAEITKVARIRERAERRALVGLRPAGFAIGRESEDLDLEEMTLEDERQHINMFGHRFLLPIGRRQTQMEIDAAPSPTPSEPDVERRQEDMNIASPASPPLGGNGAMGGQDEDMVDLDGDMEDMDDSDGAAEGEDDEDDGEQDLGEDFTNEDSDEA